MDISTIESQLKYITNSTGDKMGVIIPMDIWEAVVQLLRDGGSGLSLIDEHESKQSLLTDLQESLTQVSVGKIHPVSELWEG